MKAWEKVKNGQRTHKKILKNPHKNFLVLISLILLYQLNYSYFGIGFWSEALDKTLDYFPVLLLFLVFLNAIYSYKKKLKALFRIQLVSFILIGVFLAFSYLVKAEFIERFYLTENRKAELFFDDSYDDYYFIIEENKWFFLFEKNQCIYAQHVGPYEIKQFEDSLYLRNKEVKTGVKDEFYQVYKCEYWDDEILNFDPLRKFIIFWWKLFSLNSNIEETIQKYEKDLEKY